MFGVRLHVVQERERCSTLQKRIIWSTHLVNEKNCGYFVSASFVGFIATTFNPSEAWLICSDTTFSTLTEQEREKLVEEEVAEVSIDVYDRVGSFESPWFKKRHLNIALCARPEQQKIMDAIETSFHKTSNCVALIHGNAGSGKSMVALLLAAQLKSFYCNSLKPWQPGDSISFIWSEIEPTKKKPLIIVFDEFDGPLSRVHENAIDSHKKTPISVQDKQGWNRMLDDIARGMYPNVILILTTNQKPEFFDNLDKSYTREGRVNLVCNLE